MTGSPPPPRAVADLADRFSLGAAAAEALARYADLLAEDPQAPTTIRDRPRIHDDHLADSLVALDLDEVRAAREIADLGAGAGLPGLCLATALPGATVHLLESNRRKCGFIERAIETMGIGNARVVNLRAEEWAEGRSRCDLVTARALAGPDVVLEYAAPLLELGGSLVAWRGRDDEDAVASAERAAELLGLVIRRWVAVHPYRGAAHRHLLVAEKVQDTPERFPRRAGMAVKRPLGRP